VWELLYYPNKNGGYKTWKMKKNQLLGTEEKTEGTVTEPVEKTEKAEIKTFTQEEVNAMLTKERKKMPSKEELQEFNTWRENQKTVEQKQAEKETEYQKALLKNTELENENKVFKAGVEKDSVDYVAFKVSKMEGDFEENLTKFLKENPKYLGNNEPKIVKKVSSSMSLTGKETLNQNETNQKMNDLIRSARD